MKMRTNRLDVMNRVSKRMARGTKVKCTFRLDQSADTKHNASACRLARKLRRSYPDNFSEPYSRIHGAGVCAGRFQIELNERNTSPTSLSRSRLFKLEEQAGSLPDTFPDALPCKAPAHPQLVSSPHREHGGVVASTALEGILYLQDQGEQARNPHREQRGRTT